MAKASAAATPCDRPPNAGSASSAIAGSPRKPMPRLARVMPNWQAERYWLRSPSRCTARPARRSPESASSSRRERRDRTSANSPATKKPLASTSTTTPTRKIAVIGGRGATSREVVVHGAGLAARAGREAERSTGGRPAGGGGGAAGEGVQRRGEG